MERTADVVVIGAGHNGLTCACYLAAAGRSVRVVERRSVVGGAAVTEEFHPGFRNSLASYTVSLLHPLVIRDLRLHEHGLRIVERPLANFLPLADGRCLETGSDAAASRASIARFSVRDASRLDGYEAMLERVGTVLRALMLEAPPGEGGGLRDLARLVGLGARLRRLPLPERRDLLALATRSAADVLQGWFEAPPVQALFGFDSVVGTFASPWTPGTAYVLLHHVVGEVNGRRGAWGHAIGGMGSITQAMAAEARRLGVAIEVEAPVERVLVEDGAARGVRLAGGREIRARRVVANVDPRRLFLDLIEPEGLDADFLERIRAYRCGSATLRMNVALSELPDFRARPGTAPAPHHAAGIYLAPSLEYMERAYFDARTEGWSRAPVVEMCIPSTVDDSLAPPGAHVASLFCQHFSPTLPDGRSWDEAREAAADTVIDLVTEHAPNFRASVIARRVLTPLDLERVLGLTGGDIFHGAMSPDQLWAARPVLGHGRYRMPVRGLYLCGSGAHPGGGVTGLPGRNAAREILREGR